MRRGEKRVVIKVDGGFDRKKLDIFHPKGLFCQRARKPASILCLHSGGVALD